MQTAQIVIDPEEARELYQAYKKHQHYSEPIDQEIQRAYQLIAQGRMVIRALESIKAAGIYADGPNKDLPKLAICRSTSTQCRVDMETNGGARFSQGDWQASDYERRKYVDMPEDTFVRFDWTMKRKTSAVAIIPTCPLHLRPKRGLANYHTLWEAEWTKIVPKDPMLLRRIGKGDMWLVVAAWDLTEVERAALATRLSA